MDYARECVRLAGIANSNPELHKSLLQMAREWMAVAMHEENLPEPKSALGRQTVIRERKTCQPRL